MTRVQRWAWASLLISALCILLSPLCHSAQDPWSDGVSVQKIRELPFGLKNHPNFILQSQHISSVDFDGAASESAFGFLQQTGALQDGLWLRLLNSGEDGWATVNIHFKEPLDGRTYNSILLWVRSEKPERKLRFQIQDVDWKSGGVPQARTEIIPANGLPSNQIVQLVIPYNAIFSEGSIDLSKIDQVGIEYGRYTVGNRRSGVMDVLGIAFVNQPRTFKKVKVVPWGASDTSIAKAPPTDLSQPTPKPIPADRPIVEAYEAVMASSAPLQASTDAHARSHSALSMPFASLLAKIWNHGVQFLKKHGALLSALALFGVLLITSARLLSNRLLKSNNVRKKFNERIMMEITWWDKKAKELVKGAVEEFWEGAACRLFRRVTLPSFLTSEMSDGEDYLGEMALEQHLKGAKKVGIQIVPTLCFVRTVFNFDFFMRHPKLFSFKHVPAVDNHLSDEELKIKNIGYFPVGVSPFWQKQHGLPQRILVSYGKMPGYPFASDSVQYNLISKELRGMTAGVIKKMAAHTPMIRIEGVSSLLNSSIRLYWDDIYGASVKEGDPEFWREVITEVKGAYPGLQLIADRAGFDTETILSLGFSNYENDRLRELLLGQIRWESTDHIYSHLWQLDKALLSKSVYNLKGLVEAIEPHSSSNCQRILCAIILTLFPGTLLLSDETAPEFFEFLKTIQIVPSLLGGDLHVFFSGHRSIFSFARYKDNHLLLAIANFSIFDQTCQLDLKSLSASFDDSMLYLFHDHLHGTNFFTGLREENQRGPVSALKGADLKENGLPIKLPGLGIRILSVKLDRPVVVRRSIPKELPVPA